MRTTNLKSFLIMSVFLLAVAICTSSVFATGTYNGGDGSEGNPFQINTDAQMDEIGQHSEDWGSYFILTADISMEGQVFTMAIIAPDTSPDYYFQGTAFTGTFDGNGHKITNFTINGGNNDYLGLFGRIGSGGSVKNLGLENCAVSGYRYVGGLVGNNLYGSISNCYSTGAVSGSSYVGGLVGINSSGGSSIINCYSTGTVSGHSSVGGLVGNNNGSISDCYSTGTVSGYKYVGGLVGDGGGSISDCYSTGTVSGSSYVGGLVGSNYGSISSSFWDTQTSGRTTSSGGMGLTTAQMQTLSTFTVAGWDFVNIWMICEGIDYPRLLWQGVTCPRPPAADADGPYTIYVGDTLTLDGSGSTDDDNDIVSYMWDLDDNNSFETDAGSEAVFDVNYAYLQSLGLLINYTYTIQLKVTDSEGQSDVNDSTLIIVPKPALEVAVDIKPGSCPNPVNTKSSGVLPVAILGSDDYDITTIDPTSVRLAGVEPLRSSYEDVAGPVSDFNDCNCTTEGPDGFLDLTLKFKTQRIVEAVGDVNDGDVRVLTLTGVLFDPMPFETPIEGADCILIRGRHKPINPADINKDGTVDMADFALIAENWLRSSIVED